MVAKLRTTIEVGKKSIIFQNTLSLHTEKHWMLCLRFVSQICLTNKLLLLTDPFSFSTRPSSWGGNPEWKSKRSDRKREEKRILIIDRNSKFLSRFRFPSLCQHLAIGSFFHFFAGCLLWLFTSLFVWIVQKGICILTTLHFLILIMLSIFKIC